MVSRLNGPQSTDGGYRSGLSHSPSKNRGQLRGWFLGHQIAMCNQRSVASPRRRAYIQPTDMQHNFHEDWRPVPEWGVEGVMAERSRRQNALLQTLSIARHL